MRRGCELEATVALPPGMSKVVYLSGPPRARPPPGIGEEGVLEQAPPKGDFQDGFPGADPPPKFKGGSFSLPPKTMDGEGLFQAWGFGFSMVTSAWPGWLTVAVPVPTWPAVRVLKGRAVSESWEEPGPRKVSKES